MNKFQCSHDNCKRVLNSERTNSFKCSMCGHGNMVMIQPKASCSNCDNPIYDNVDIREEIDIICADCTSRLLQGEPVKADENARRGKSFGERVRSARRRLGWSQERVAEYLGFKSKVSIMKYEKGLRYPKKKVLEKVLGWTREVEGLGKGEVREWLKEARV
ncbi:hypothetical protein ES705_07558 [subsurface metagenome]